MQTPVHVCCHALAGDGYQGFIFVLLNVFWTAFWILRKRLQSELLEPPTGRILSACSMSICQLCFFLSILSIPERHPLSAFFKE